MGIKEFLSKSLIYFKADLDHPDRIQREEAEQFYVECKNQLSVLISDKKQLLAALGPWVPAMVGQGGEERAATVFADIDSDKALEINKEIIENLREEFNAHRPIGITPQQFIRIAARNIDLNDQLELLHFMFQVGLMWETTVNRLEEMKKRIPPTEPNIEDN